jgi:uncharacterized protein (TIRG00374 family)
MTSDAPKRRGFKWYRYVGVVLLAGLLFFVDVEKMLALVARVDPLPLLAAFLLTVPMTFFKALRWRETLAPFGVRYGVKPATAAYFASVFVGIFTPGKLGEFAKAAYVKKELGVSTGGSISTALVDRLFDLYFLALVGGVSAAALILSESDAYLVGVVALLAAAPLVLVLNNRVFAWIRRLGSKLGATGARMFRDDGFAVELRRGVKELPTKSVALAAFYTVVANGVNFFQGFLVARGMGLDIGYLDMCGVVSLANLAAIMPVTVFNLGTREAVYIGVLGEYGFSPETAVALSLMFFFTYHIGAAIQGAIAIAIKPLPLSLDDLKALRRKPEPAEELRDKQSDDKTSADKPSADQ